MNKKSINLYKLINFYYGKHHYYSQNNTQTWWPIRLHKIDLNIKQHKRIKIPNHPDVGGSLNNRRFMIQVRRTRHFSFCLYAGFVGGGAKVLASL